MAKRRKVSNLLALAVLTTVIERPMHPYEIASLLRARGKERDMNIKWGTFYTVVQNLEKHGFIEATENERQGGRPERTIYRLTPEGRAELDEWIRDLIVKPDREASSFEAALSVIGLVPPDEAISLLQQRLRGVNEHLSALREAFTGYRNEGVPRMFLMESEFELAMREAEASWIEALLEELTSGAMPELAGWRAWHETGEIPAGYEDLAARSAGTPRAGK